MIKPSDFMRGVRPSDRPFGYFYTASFDGREFGSFQCQTSLKFGQITLTFNFCLYEVDIAIGKYSVNLFTEEDMVWNIGCYTMDYYYDTGVVKDFQIAIFEPGGFIKDDSPEQIILLLNAIIYRCFLNNYRDQAKTRNSFQWNLPFDSTLVHQLVAETNMKIEDFFPQVYEYLEKIKRVERQYRREVDALS